jgi:hypothetical protein
LGGESVVHASFLERDGVFDAECGEHGDQHVDILDGCLVLRFRSAGVVHGWFFEGEHRAGLAEVVGDGPHPQLVALAGLATIGVVEVAVGVDRVFACYPSRQCRVDALWVTGDSGANADE